MTKKELLADELLTVADLITYFKKSPTTIYRWLQNGTLKKSVIGGAVYVRASDVKDSILELNTKAA